MNLQIFQSLLRTIIKINTNDKNQSGLCNRLIDFNNYSFISGDSITLATVNKSIDSICLAIEELNTSE